MAWASDRYLDINSKERTWDVIFIDIWSDKVVIYILRRYKTLLNSWYWDDKIILSLSVNNNAWILTLLHHLYDMIIDQRKNLVIIIVLIEIWHIRIGFFRVLLGVSKKLLKEMGDFLTLKLLPLAPAWIKNKNFCQKDGIFLLWSTSEPMVIFLGLKITHLLKKRFLRHPIH